MGQKTSELGQIRCEEDQKQRWHRAAEKAAKKNGRMLFSAWVRKALDEAATRDLGD